MFDSLLLLCEGQVAYYGDIKHCPQYFSDLGMPCPLTYNLADHICKLNQSLRAHKDINKALF